MLYLVRAELGLKAGNVLSSHRRETSCLVTAECHSFTVSGQSFSAWIHITPWGEYAGQGMSSCDFSRDSVWGFSMEFPRYKFEKHPESAPCQER